MSNKNNSERQLKVNIILHFLEWFSDFINHISIYIVVVLMITMTIIVLLQVFCRFILNNALSWPEEISRYIMIWICFLGSGIACKYKAHIGVDFIIKRIHKKLQPSIRISTNICILVFLAFCIWKGLYMTQFTINQLSPASQISMAWPYSSVPVGSFFMMVHIFVSLFKKS